MTGVDEVAAFLARDLEAEGEAAVAAVVVTVMIVGADTTTATDFAGFARRVLFLMVRGLGDRVGSTYDNAANDVVGFLGTKQLNGIMRWCYDSQ